MTKRIKAGRPNFAPTFASWEHFEDSRKARIVARAEQLYRKHLVGDEHVPGSCLYWAVSVIAAAAETGLRLIPQAGTASFQRLPGHLDDGAPTTLTHFGYEWQPGSRSLVNLGGRLVLPEMHVWAADPVAGEIVDLSTRHLVEMCQTVGGLPWLEAAPPRFLWARQLPAGWHYAPTREATELAVRFATEALAEEK
jgi:hypothetical protein